MPVYTYRCENCGREFDRRQSFSDQPLRACPNCKKRTLQKVYRPAGVVFKGSGFYVTDKKKSTTTTNGTKEKTKDGAKETKTESKKEPTAEKKATEIKPAAKDD